MAKPLLQRVLPRSVSWRIEDRLLPSMFIERPGGRRCLLMGTGRSGTTWVEELINFRDDHRVIFEPFALHNPRGSKLFHSRCPYFGAGQWTDEHAAALRYLFGGCFRDAWMDCQNGFGRVYRHRLIKAIRCLAFADHVVQTFPDMPVVYLVRNPYAVLLSMRKGEWFPQIPQDEFLALLLGNDALVEAWTGRHEKLIRSCTSQYEQRMLLWALANRIAMSVLKPGDALLLFYEDIMREPELFARQLIRHVGGTFDESMLKNMERPSATARNAHNHRAGEHLVRWRQELTPREIDRGAEILDAFGMMSLYDDESMPTPERLGMEFLSGYRRKPEMAD